MVMTNAEASNKLQNLIKFYEVSIDLAAIPIVEIPFDKYDILALQIAIEALKKADLIDRLANIKSEPITPAGRIRRDLIQILNKRKAGDPDAH